MRAAGPVCHWQGHKFLSVHQHFSLPPVAYEACRCSRISPRGSPFLQLRYTGGHDVNKPNATTKQITEEIYRASASRRKKPGRRQIGEPQPLFLHSILPSIHSWTHHWITQEKISRSCCPYGCAYPSPTTTHLIACICTEAGGFQGAGAGGLIDPTVCAEVSDESSGPVRSAMEPQWKGSMTSCAERVRKLPSVFKATESGIEESAAEENLHFLYFRLRINPFTEDITSLLYYHY